MRRAVLLTSVVLLVAVCACSASQLQTAVPPLRSSAGAAASDAWPLRPDLNERFLDPELDPRVWQERFETEAREIFRARAAIVAALELTEGMRVADVGAGTGLFLPLFAEEVGETGSVHAVDISPRFLEHLRERVDREGLSQVRVVAGTEKSVELPDGSVDVVFTCDTYHHFSFPQSSLASILRALRPGGALVVIDFERIPGVSRNWVLEHVRAGKADFRAEIEQAGFEFEGDIAIEGLDENYMLVFQRPPD